MLQSRIIHWPQKVSKAIRILKFTAFLVSFFCMKVNGGVSAQVINLDLKNVTIKKVFQEIQRQTGYQFLYPDEILDTKKKMSIELRGASIDEAMTKCISSEALDYVIDEKTIIIRKKQSPSSPVVTKPAAIDISGKVTDENGEPVVGASVVVKGSGTGVSTDASGNFRLSVGGANTVLVISSVGFQTKEVTVPSSGIVNVSLSKKEDTIEDVVVVGYGTQKKVDVTGAISTISADKVNQGVNQSVSHALQGRASGVTVIQNSGEPGAGVEIRIRGAGSINDNSPLYVVDGIIGGIGGINPADIESISILKDAASAAIYGSRGANGVVIVTTKKGKRDQPTTVSLNTSQGMQQAWKVPSSLSAEDRNLIHKEALTNDGTPTSDPIWDYYNDPDNAVTRTDWFKEVFRSAYFSSQDLAIRGGSKRSNYSLSFGFLNNNGIVLNSNFKRYNARFNSQTELFKNLTFGENISIVGSRQQAANTRSAYDGVLSSALFNMRNTPVWEDQANQIYGTPSGDFPNPVASLNSRENVSKGVGVGGNAYLEYKFLGMFTAKTDIAYNWGFSKGKNFTAIALGGGRGLNENSLSENYYVGSTWIWNNTLNFDKRLGQHHVAALIGTSAEYGINEFTGGGTAKNFSNQDEALRYYNNASTFPDHASGWADDYSLQGYFGRVSYEYADRYLFAANIRRDGSSKFAPDRRWGTFPSVSAGWRISKENFFQSATKIISDFKIRGSWGQLGNDKIPNYQFYSTVSSVGSPTLGGVQFTSVAQNRMANTTIQWEVTTQTDIGIDLGFLNNRLTLSADYYDKKTTDILVRVPLVSSYGVGEAPFRNAGEVSNKGFEISATYRGGNTSKLGYEFTANVAHVKNKLETLGVSGAKEIFTSDYKNTSVGRIAEGEAIGHFYVLNALGIFKSQAEVDAYKDKDGNIIQPLAVAGDVKFEDVNGDGVISAKDRVNAGNSFPQFTYSLNTNLTYGRFDFNMLWSGSQGNKIFNGLDLGGIIMQGSGYNNKPEILGRWTADNPNASIPRVSMKDLNSNRTYSTLFIEDGSFLRMKYLTFGYTISNDALPKQISNLRVFATFQNLITITKYSGYDPEIGADVDYSSNIYGVDRGAYPQTRAYILGLNINF